MERKTEISQKKKSGAAPSSMVSVPKCPPEQDPQVQESWMTMMLFYTLLSHALRCIPLRPGGLGHTHWACRDRVRAICSRSHIELEPCNNPLTIVALLDNCCQGQNSAIRPARQSAEPSRHPNGPDCRRRLWRKLIGGAVLGGGGIGARVREDRKTK